MTKTALRGGTPPSPNIAEKERLLRLSLEDCGSVVIGFSGGVDSAYLAVQAHRTLGPSRALSVTGRSPSYPEIQHRMVRTIVRSFDLRHLEIDTHELADPEYAANPENRCYFCKIELYRRLATIARSRGYDTVCDGSNADDLDDYRPGLAAARELGVRSPLQEAGLTKEDVRHLSRELGLPTWDQPASPCLASRIPYGLRVTERRLREIEDAESSLRHLVGSGDLRVRHHGSWARVEVQSDELRRFRDPEFRARVARALRAAGFRRACVDLQGYRRGSLNEGMLHTVTS